MVSTNEFFHSNFYLQVIFLSWVGCPANNKSLFFSSIKHCDDNWRITCVSNNYEKGWDNESFMINPMRWLVPMRNNRCWSAENHFDYFMSDPSLLKLFTDEQNQKRKTSQTSEKDRRNKFENTKFMLVSSRLTELLVDQTTVNR